ncbi:MAG: ABC transporter ATP-binding protein [Burkholderiaceae bacterium]|nr:ABC transporter ATP-binding protein [Burkholderiaceae bacterium]
MLEVENLQVRYGKVLAIRDLSLKVTSGSIVALVGANGAGKSTTLRAIVGLQGISAGEIRFEGQSIGNMPASDAVRHRIALCPEGRRLFRGMSVFENLLVGAHACLDKQSIAVTLARIYEHFPLLKERKRQLASSLSGGEQQMVAIGRALMAQPRLLLLDEPSLGLAPQLVREIAHIVMEVSRAASLSTLLVEQNAKMALRLCDYAYVLENGVVAMEGTGREMLQSSYVQKAYLGI